LGAVVVVVALGVILGLLLPRCDLDVEGPPPTSAPTTDLVHLTPARNGALRSP